MPCIYCNTEGQATTNPEHCGCGCSEKEFDIVKFKTECLSKDLDDCHKSLLEVFTKEDTINIIADEFDDLQLYMYDSEFIGSGYENYDEEIKRDLRIEYLQTYL